MSEETPQKRSLSEISHLFLSSVRDKQTNGAPRPQRIPPGQARPMPSPPVPADAILPPRSEDLTPEELAHVISEPGVTAPRSAPAMARRTPPIAAVLGAHLNGRQFDRVKEYARHLAAISGRIGLIELDASEVRLMSFEAGDSVLDPDLDEPESAERFDMHEVAEALEEMNCDVDRWLLLVPNPRTPEARALLRCVNHWVLLSTCDHDGVVSSYRLLKGLAESYRPRLSLALLDGVDKTETERVYRKLSSVCQQFLNWDLEDEPAVRKSTRMLEHLVLCCRPTRDKGQLATAPQWGIVDSFLQSLKAAPAPAPAAESQQNHEELEPMRDDNQNAAEVEGGLEEIGDPAPATRPQAINPFGTAPQAKIASASSMQAPSMAAGQASPPISAQTSSATSRPEAAGRIYPAPVSNRDSHVEVIDLPATDAGAESIITAILNQNRGELVECPVRAPMCVGVRLAITRERRMVLLAVAREGLSDLRAIGQAYRWVSENRALIGMAIPQFAIDASLTPCLRLLVDYNDVAAEILHPILHSDHVTVQAYRKCRWGEKMGLFLEAA